MLEPKVSYETSLFTNDVYRVSPLLGCSTPKERKDILIRKSVELFMIGVGFSLIFLGSFSILGSVILIASGCSIASSLNMHTYRAIFNGGVKDRLGKILGGVERIDKLPILKDGDQSGIGRLTDSSGKTTSVIFRYRVSRTTELFSNVQYHTVMFLLNSSDGKRNNFKCKKRLNNCWIRRLYIRSEMPAGKEYFLNRLIQEKGHLVVQRDDEDGQVENLVFEMNKGVDWSQFIKSYKFLRE